MVEGSRVTDLDLLFVLAVSVVVAALAWRDRPGPGGGARYEVGGVEVTDG